MGYFMQLPNDHAAKAKKILDEIWEEVINADEKLKSDSLGTQIDFVFEGKEVGYKKALIIQLVGKAADFSLDAQALQKGSGVDGAWDAREFAKRVFVPWNASIGSPLGDSDDPYVANQFRNPKFDLSIRAKRRGKPLFDAVLDMLERANRASTSEEVVDLLKQVLFGLRRQLANKSFQYAVPHRASLEATLSALSDFLSVASGGGRLQAVAQALFMSLSDAGFDYQKLAARHVNASDQAGHLPGDISFSKSDRRNAIEVKDRFLDVAQVRASITKARIADITELVFLVHDKGGDRLFGSADDEQACREIAKKEFSSGLNIYWESYLRLSRSILVLIGEHGRREFLMSVGKALEEQSMDAQHRWAWAKIVAEI
jgi:hypothetical protein